jgi:hypothetical protein
LQRCANLSMPMKLARSSVSFICGSNSIKA